MVWKPINCIPPKRSFVGYYVFGPVAAAAAAAARRSFPLSILRTTVLIISKLLIQLQSYLNWSPIVIENFPPIPLAAIFNFPKRFVNVNDYTYSRGCKENRWRDLLEICHEQLPLAMDGQKAFLGQRVTFCVGHLGFSSEKTQKRHVIGYISATNRAFDFQTRPKWSDNYLDSILGNGGHLWKFKMAEKKSTFSLKMFWQSFFFLWRPYWKIQHGRPKN